MHVLYKNKKLTVKRLHFLSLDHCFPAETQQIQSGKYATWNENNHSVAHHNLNRTDYTCNEKE